MRKVSLFLIVLLFAGFKSMCYTGQVEKSFATPAHNPTGVCFDGVNLWTADRGTDKIYCVNSNSGLVIREIESPAYWPMGLAWDGKFLWNADFRGRTNKSEDLDGMIFKIDPNDGTILKTLIAPTKCPIGLTWDGQYLWCVDNVSDKVIQFSSEDGTTIKSFASPANDPKGITWDGKYLWITDRATDEIYMVDPNTGYVIIIADAPGENSHGITFNNNHLWVADCQDDKIFQLKVRDNQNLVKKDAQFHKVVFNHQVTCFGPGKIKTLDVFFALPQNRDNQELLSDVSYNINPTKIETDQWSQKTARFSFKNLKPGEQTNIQVTTKVKTYNVRYFIYPENVGSLSDIPKAITNKYLNDNEKYQISSKVIQKTVKSVVGDETNAYWIVRKLHQYLIGHLHYIMDGQWDTAPTVLTNGHGSCSEYSFAFIALCKAAGVPTRYVGSTWDRRELAYMDDVYHRWVEVYLPNYGWIPTDPTHGDRKSPRGQAFPIGFVSNTALITTQSGGGSKTMEWTYNTNEKYTTEPKTNLNIIHFADWNKLDAKIQK